MKHVRRLPLGGHIALVASLALAWSAGLARATHTVINVATVAELEAAVQVPGAIVKVAPGTYALTQNITLAEGTQLIGSNKMSDTDRDGIPDPITPPDEFVVPGTETKIVAHPSAAGTVIGGTRSNRVANLTVEGPEAGRGILGDVEEVTDCLIDGTPAGAVRNDICTFFSTRDCTDCEAKAILRRTVTRDCANGAGYSNNATTDASLKVFMSGNRFYRNNIGAHLIGALGATTSSVDVVSIGNLMEDNSGQGWLVVGGRFAHDVIPGNLTGGHGSRAAVYSFGDVFRDNGQGVVGIASLRSLISGENTDNRVQITLLKARLEQDPPPGPAGPRADISLFGGAAPPTVSPGTNNVVQALLLGSRVEVDPGFELQLTDSTPPGAGNEVVLIGSEKTFTLLNDPFDVNTFGVEFCEFFTAGCPE